MQTGLPKWSTMRLQNSPSPTVPPWNLCTVMATGTSESCFLKSCFLKQHLAYLLQFCSLAAQEHAQGWPGLHRQAPAARSYTCCCCCCGTCCACCTCCASVSVCACSSSSSCCCYVAGRPVFAVAIGQSHTVGVLERVCPPGRLFLVPSNK